MRHFAPAVLLTAACVALGLLLAQPVSGATASYQIAASQDDTTTSSSGSLSAGTIIYFPYTTNERLGFLRWPIRIPKGATITSAYLRTCAENALNQNATTLRLHLVDSDNCPAFNLSNPFTAAVTATFVDSVYTTWTAGQWYQSSDIKSLVQEFIDRPGYAYGNYLGLRGSNAGGGWKNIYQYDFGTHTNGAILEVNYTGGSALVDLWMADPEVRLGQKIYCQLVNVNPTDKLQALLDGEVFYEKVGNFQAEEVVTANYRTLLAGEHTLTIRIVSSENVERGSAGRTWIKLHDGIGRVGIDENNAICRNGQPFFPLGCYGLDLPLVPQWSGEFNTLFGQGWNVNDDIAGWGSYLDGAATLNLPAAGPWQGNFWPDGHTDNVWEDPPGTIVRVREVDIDRLAAYVLATKDRPALLMWNWRDEPDLGGGTEYIPATEVRRWTDKCHELDTEHPVMTGIVGYGFGQQPEPNYNQDRAKCYCFMYDDLKTAATGNVEAFPQKTVVADVFCFDYYPYEYATKYDYCNLENYLLAVDRMVQWNYNLLPCISWIETCDIRAVPDGYDPSPAPTPAELKNLIWTTIIHNCKGIGWFHYFEPTPAENKAVMATAVRQITELTPAILGPEEVSRAVSCVETGGGRVDVMAREHLAKLYVFTANTRTTTATARVTVAGLEDGEFVQVYEEGRAIEAEDGYFEDTFDPLGVHIYVIGSGVGTPGVPNVALCTVDATTPLYANGATWSVITVTVHDGYDGPVVGELPQNILVDVTGGTGNVLLQPSVPTDAQGRTYAYLSTTSAGLKIVSASVREQALTGTAQVEAIATPIMLAYTGADLTGVQPGTTAGQTMTITCRDILGGRDLWALDVFRWIATAQSSSPQVRFTRFDDLTDTGSFNYAVSTGNGLFQAHSPAANGLDIYSYAELHKGADYFEFSLTEHAANYDIVTVYRINPSTPSGTTFTATRTLTNLLGTTLVPGGVMNSHLILNDADYNPRLASGQLSGYVYGNNTQHHQALPGPTDALWLLTDNMDRGDNPAFSAAGTLWAQAEVLDNGLTSALGLVAGRTFTYQTGLVGYYPSNAIGNITFDNRADYLDGIHFDVAPLEWLGSKRADHAAGIPAGGSVTVTCTLGVNIQSAAPPAVDAGLSSVDATSPVAADGVATSVVTITVKNSDDVGLTGLAGGIQIAASGEGDSVSAVSEVGGGVYQATVTSTVAETKTVTVTVLAVALTDQPQIVFTAPPLPDLVIVAELDYPWVYQNTPVTTQDRHLSVLAVEITGGATAGETYAATILENGGPVASFQVDAGTLPAALAESEGVFGVTVNLRGGRRDTTTAGTYTLKVTVTGTPSGQTASVDVPLRLRLLGDIVEDGIVNASDKLEMNKKLNGLDTLAGLTLRDLDLSGDGVLVNAEDKLAINQILNGLVVP